MNFAQSLVSCGPPARYAYAKKSKWAHDVDVQDAEVAVQVDTLKRMMVLARLNSVRVT